MTYFPVHLNRIIEIPKIVTVHYFEYNSQFSFSGESHDFWEFLCVDKGDVEVTADSHTYQLSRGDIIFHKPNEFHRLTVNSTHAPNLVVIAFVCHSRAMKFFCSQLLKVDTYERQMLAKVIQKARIAFTDPLDDPLLMHMHERKDAPAASKQLLALHLELFLLHLMERYSTPVLSPATTETIRQNTSDESFYRIQDYMYAHLNEHLTIERISKDLLLSTSQLQQLVQQQKHCGVIRYFCKLKIRQAKQMIRDNQMNFTEISDYLGYSSVHYFSRQFKQLSGMTPSEYSSSIQKLSDDAKEV